MRWSSLFLCVVLWVGAPGCGDDDGGGPASDGGAGGADASDPGELEAVCQDACAHAAGCGWVTDAESCAAECAASVDMFRVDALLLQWMCLGELACETDNPGETCYVESAAELEAHAVHEQYHADCTAAGTACGGLPGDVCAVDGVIMFSDTYMEEQVMPCLELECAALSACLEEKVLDAF